MNTPKSKVISIESHDASPSPTSVFPFGEVVGLDDAKLALLLAAVDPAIGGVLLRGEKGSAKTTLSRGLASLLGDETPFVNLPLGASEDRVVGTIDLGAALTDNKVKLSPGLLAEAHTGVLYVDEVNLLADHIVDTLLDVAVSGTNRVEREGISQTHPAKFILVGSMNPEQGELRPQLLDRFGLCVDVVASREVSTRVEAVARRLNYEGLSIDHSPSDSDSGASSDGHTVSGTADPAEVDAALAERLRSAVPATISTAILELCSELAVSFEVEGLRADLVLARTAAAFAGFEGRSSTTAEDLRRIAPLVLVHRGRKSLFDPGVRPADQVEALVDDVLSSATEPQRPTDTQNNSDSSQVNRETTAGGTGVSETNSATEVDVDLDEEASLASAEHPEDELVAANDHQPTHQSGADQSSANQSGADTNDSGDSGLRPFDTIDDDSSTKNPMTHTTAELRLPPFPPTTNRQAKRTTPASNAVRGRTLRDLPFDPTTTNPIAVAGSVRNLITRREHEPDATLGAQDLRESVRQSVRPDVIIFAVDASGSMGANDRADAAVGAIRSLLTGAYQNRSQVALITFAGSRADVVLTPTRSVEVANLRVSNLTTGGPTPLAAGIDAARTLAQDRRYIDRNCTIVLLTDGRATGVADAAERSLLAARSLQAAGIPTVVLDCEDSMPRLGLAERIAEEAQAVYIQLGSVTADSISEAVSFTLGGVEEVSL